MGFTFWDWDKETELIGIFVGQYKSIGRFKKNVLAIRTEDGVVVHTWAYVQLMNVFHGVPFQSKVKLNYLGMQKMPEKPHRLFKDFSMEVLDAPAKVIPNEE